MHLQPTSAGAAHIREKRDVDRGVVTEPIVHESMRGHRRGDIGQHGLEALREVSSSKDDIVEVS